MKRLLIAASLLLPLQAAAVLPYAMTDAEIAALPALCVAKMKGNNPPNLVAQFGASNWMHMHHYCHGVKFVNRARVHPKDRRTYLDAAKGEYSYVIKHANPDFWFRPQLHLELARAHMQLGETVEAQTELYAAIEFNRRFEAAYVSLIELQDSMGARSSALETAAAGLRYLPESARLQKAYLDRGGKLPFPEAVVTAPPGGTSVGPAAPAVQTEPDPVSLPSVQALEIAPEQPGTTPDSERACRFCPPEEIQQRWDETFQTRQ